MKLTNSFKHFSIVFTLGITSILACSSIIIMVQLLQLNEKVITISAATILVSAIIVSFFYWWQNYRPLKTLTLYLEKISKGYYVELTQKHLGKAPLFRYIKRISHKYLYLANNINQLTGKESNLNGNTDIKTDLIKTSLNALATHLDKIEQEEKNWREKERIRTWSNQGVAKFSELVRKNNADFELNARIILKELVNYINAKIGGLFIYEEKAEDERYLKMLAAYAYNRDKIADKQIHFQDGLYGAACFERQTIYMTDIPSDYLEIKSGMGSTQPKSLLIVPLLNDKEFLGIIELASFNKFQKHEIEFIEKIAGIIASDFSIKKLSETTHELLEQSQLQTKELAKQEVELRQNMEELQAQQEEMAYKKNELEESEKLMRNIIDLVPFPIFVKNIKRQYIMANQEQAKLFNLTVEGLIGRSDSDLINNTDELHEIGQTDSRVFNDNETVKLPEQSISLPNGTHKIMQTIKVPFVNNITNNRNLLGVSIDYTEQRKIERELAKTKEEVSHLKLQTTEAIN